MTLFSGVELLGVCRDWLDVRVPLDFVSARQFLSSALTASNAKYELKDWTPLGRLGYAKGCEVAGPPNAGSLRLMGDHRTRKGWSLFSSSQQCSEWLHQAITRGHPETRFELAPQVNRVDVAVDFILDVNRADEVFKFALSIADTYNLERYREGVPGRGEQIFLNWSKKPEFRKSRNASLPCYSARIYQKGIQQGAYLDVPDPPSPDWWRFELIYRPDKPEQKASAFELTPQEILASKGWVLAFLEEIGYESDIEIIRIRSPTVVQVDDELAKQAKAYRTLAHMADQYRKAAQELAKLIGWEKVEELIIDAFRADLEPGVRPGDNLRDQADRLWVERYNKRYTMKKSFAGHLATPPRKH